MSALAANAADWASVQTKQDITGTGTSKAVAFVSPVTNGSIVVGGNLLVGGAMLKSVTDDKGNIYVLTGQGQQYGQNSVQGFRSLHLITNAPQTLTFTYQTSGTVWIDMAEFSPPTGTTDISLDGSQILVNSSALTSQNYIIRNSDVLQYAASFSTGTSTTGAGWTASAGSGTAQCSEWRIQATPTSTANATFATQTGSTWIVTFGIAPVARTTWELRQSQITRGNNAVSSGSVVFPNPVAAGSIVVGSIAVGTPTGPTLAAGLTSFVDDKSNPYSLVAGTLGNPGGTGDRQIFWSGGKLANAPQTITASFNATEAIIYFLVGEYIPPPNTASVAVDGGVNTTASLTTPNITTTKNGDLLYSFEDDAGQNVLINSGLSQNNGGSTSDTFADAWGTLPTAGTTNAVWTANAGQANTALAAFSATSGNQAAVVGAGTLGQIRSLSFGVGGWLSR